MDNLPHAQIRARVTPTSQTDGYVKYAFPGGINMIFSSIPISEDDMLAGATAPTRAVLDHKGVDLRTETDEVRAHQCPYCIDSFTNSCVDHEVSAELIHASAALSAGVHLVHGVQTRNALIRCGAL